MMKLFSIKNRNHVLIYAAFAVFYLWLAAQIPYTHDDWDWGIEIGFHQLIYATINSRYAGNFFEVIMTRSETLKTVIMGAGYFLIPFSLSRMVSLFFDRTTESKKLALFMICNVLLLTMNREMWRQTYGWAAGYANFVISALFMMPWITELIGCCDSNISPKTDSRFILLLYFLLSLTSQLFVENVSIYHVCVGVFVCFVFFYRSHKIPARTISMLLGAAVGLVTAFSSSLYDTLFATGAAVGTYRQIPLLSENGIVYAIYHICMTAVHLSNRLYSRNFVLVSYIAIMLTILIYKSDLKKVLKKPLLRLNLLMCILLIIGFWYDILAEIHHKYVYIIDSLLSVTYFFVVLLETWLLFRNSKAIRDKLLLLWISPVVVIAPLIITTEVGARLFFTTNIFLILFGLILTVKVSSDHCVPDHKLTVLLITFIAGCALLFHGLIYQQIGECKRERDAIIQNAKATESTVIVLPSYPHSQYLHAPNPTNESREEFFKAFYEIPMDVELIFME